MMAKRVFVLALVIVNAPRPSRREGLSNVSIINPQFSTITCGRLNCTVDSCPPSLYCSDGQCLCLDYPLGSARCEGADLWVMKSYCVTLDEKERVLLIGNCVYTSFVKSVF